MKKRLLKKLHKSILRDYWENEYLHSGKAPTRRTKKLLLLYSKNDRDGANINEQYIRNHGNWFNAYAYACDRITGQRARAILHMMKISDQKRF